MVNVVERAVALRCPIVECGDGDVCGYVQQQHVRLWGLSNWHVTCDIDRSVGIPYYQRVKSSLQSILRCQWSMWWSGEGRCVALRCPIVVCGDGDVTSSLDFM
jgi:hypothetical protein